jgi:DNA-binding LacI/PurR family transcriptional regulator
VRQPVWEIGRQVIEMLVMLLEDNPPQVQQLLLAPEVIVRESSLTRWH